MNVPLTGQAGWFTRAGAFIGEYNRIATTYGTPAINGFNSIWSQFASSDQVAVNNLPTALSTFQQSGQTYLGVLQQDGQTAAVLQVSDYDSVVPYTLQTAVTILAAQMVSTGQTIQRPTLAVTITSSIYATNYSDATLAVGFTNPQGAQLDMTIAETISVTCTSAATYQETLTAVGQATVAPSSYLWPNGSGANYSFSLTDGATNGLLTDGNFTSWGGTGGNQPTFWTIVNGAAGVTVFQGTPGFRTATSPNLCFKITSDGSSLTAAQQTLSVTADTTYGFNVYLKMSATDGAGRVIIALVDENGNVINNDAGTPQSAILTMSSATPSASNVGTTYAAFPVFFQTPRGLPITTGLRIGFLTAPTAAKSLSISLAAGVAPQQMYAGGPYVAGYSGNNASAVGDSWALAITSTAGVNTFVMGLNRLYNFASLGISFPSSGSPTIPDSLV